MFIENTRYEWFLVTTTVLNIKINEAENKKPATSSLVTATVLNTKIWDVEKTMPGHAKCITTKKFNKLTAENIKERVKQADSVSDNDFDNKIKSFNKELRKRKQNI